MKNKIEQFEEKEAQFIAKLILKRLEVEPIILNESFLPTFNCRKVIEEIESIESTWSFETEDSTNTFGRKVQGETIRLWSVPKMTAKVLKNLVALTNARSILEVGTSSGFSTLHLATGAIKSGGHVKTIENLPIKVKMARDNFIRSGLNNIQIIEGDANNILPTLEDSFDFIFLDADKENYGKHFNILLPKLKIGGLIVADNINDFGHMMIDFLQKVSGTHFPNSHCDNSVISTHIAQLDNGLMVVKRIR